MVMDEYQYELLAQHLSTLDKCILSFCDINGFTEQFSGIGRYPRRRINKYEGINLYFDLQMDLDKDGSRFEKFFPEIPYSLGMGAWFDEDRDRYFYNEWCFQHMPFNQVQDELCKFLESNYLTMNTWSKEWLLKNGKKSSLK